MGLEGDLEWLRFIIARTCCLIKSKHVIFQIFTKDNLKKHIPGRYVACNSLQRQLLRSVIILECTHTVGSLARQMYDM